MKISELDQYLADNPHLEQGVNGAPIIADAMRVGMKKPDDGFRDILREMKKKHHNAKINTW